MPTIIVRLSNQQDQRFVLPKNKILIGRGEECDLILPNVSVSRVHAEIQITRSGVTISDVASENGIRVKGKHVREAELTSGDEILIGNFSLVFLGDRQEDKFYRGRAIVYLPTYEPRHNKPTQEATHKLSLKEAQRLMREKAFLNSACIVDFRGRKLFPEANPMTFGDRNAMISIQGFWIRGIVATLLWNGKQHVIEKKGWFTTMKINGRAKSEVALQHRDHIQICRSSFTYVVTDMIKKK